MLKSLAVTLLISRYRSKDQTGRLIAQFNKHWSEIRDILAKHWKILLSDGAMC